jgi:NTE family protein
MDQPARQIHVVINACELRTGTAFRFGTRESGSSRYGHLSDNTIPVAHAVAASAAYPIFLPAIDERLEFVDLDSQTRTERVLLTDGGVYDNLGTSCLLPGRSQRHSTNVHPVDFIIAADAGHGTFDDDAYPMWWPTRTKRSFEAIYRKTQDAGRTILHDARAAGRLSGFAMPYLGQRDRALPWQPPDLVPRSAVAGYPTNFSKMTDHDIDTLARRGEQLTRLTIEHHCPGITSTNPPRRRTWTTSPSIEPHRP